MKSIDLMVHEHTYIKRMLTVIRKYCLKILNHKQINYADFYKAIDFVRNYADKHHHSKEEDILFKRVNQEVDNNAAKSSITGMFIEHDSGRLFIQNLERAVGEVENGNMDARLDIIGNAIAYTDLLNRHIDKEDNVIYVFAEKNLSQAGREYVEEYSREVENSATSKKIQKNYIDLLEELEKGLA
ncbi:MAG: hemerythrin [Desulfitibacter sp. BRH_c19]|nr:MAG: hemerythrin [Desulfitibacter sp. BRH_c19]